uniref:Uncharacterized protein n=1 Tax=viral metagenome TaxID=1070528 RepID=A0A6H2A2W8_9ZZZZ
MIVRNMKGGQRINAEDYIWWDDKLKRYDLTTRAFLEQTDPEVEALIKLVLRSWFIPPEKAGQLSLFT